MKSLLLFSTLLLTTSLFAQQPGNLDESFGRNGRTWDTVGRNAQYPAMLVQPDDKIIVGGSGFLKGSGIKTFRIDRLLKNGRPDNSFGDSGKVLVKFQLSRNEENHEAFITVMALQTDGKIVAAGTYRREHDPYGYLVVMRFMPNGSLDSSFGINGMSIPDVDGSSAAVDMQLQADGKIVICGLNVFAEVSGFFFIERLLPNGTLDSTFGNKGQVINKQGAFSSLAIQPDGKILAAGDISGYSGKTTRVLIRRYLTDGMPDLSFGENGAVDTALGGRQSSYLSDIILQPDGKVLGVGRVDAADGNFYYMLLTRFSNDGHIDKTFGNNGVATSSYLVSFTKILLSNNRILLSGVTIPNSVYNLTDFAVAAYYANGTADSSFASNGLLINNYDYNDNAGSAALQSDGKILLVGVSRTYEQNIAVRNLFRYYGYPAQTSLLAENKTTALKKVIASFTLSPNPAKNYLFINGLSANDKTTIVMSDALGKGVAVYNTSGASQYKCDVSKLNAGVYYVQINSAGKTVTLKFVKE